MMVSARRVSEGDMIVGSVGEDVRRARCVTGSGLGITLPVTSKTPWVFRPPECADCPPDRHPSRPDFLRQAYLRFGRAKGDRFTPREYIFSSHL